MRLVDCLLLILNFVFSVGGEDSARSQASCRPDVAGRGQRHAQVTGGAGNDRPSATESDSDEPVRSSKAQARKAAAPAAGGSKPKKQK